MGVPGNRKCRIFFLGFLCFLPKVSFIIGLIIIDDFQANSLWVMGLGKNESPFNYDHFQILRKRAKTCTETCRNFMNSIKISKMI